MKCMFGVRKVVNLWIAWQLGFTISCEHLPQPQEFLLLDVPSIVCHEWLTDIADCFQDTHAGIFKGFEVQTAEGLEGSGRPKFPRGEQESMTYHHWCGKPLNQTARTPFCAPSCLFKDLDKGVMRN
eukprot:351079-Pelagomonas_calceolata.AAC.1